MSATLIGVGFTCHTTDTPDLEALQERIDATFPDTLSDEELTQALAWDAGERIYQPENPDRVREALKRGMAEYYAAGWEGTQESAAYTINGTDRTFVWTGGLSWGDDPFDGFTDLIAFTEWISTDEDLAALAWFYGFGIVPEGIQLTEVAA